MSDGDQRVFSLIASGQAVSRSEIARALDIAPSTAALRVQELIDAGLVREDGEGHSTGGRKPRRLIVNTAEGGVAGIDLGGHHARIGVVDMVGAVQAATEIPTNLDDGPEAVLTRCVDAAYGLAETTSLRAIGLAIPGPVDFALGRITTPSRMPGWSSFPVRDWLAEKTGLTTAVDNDANLMAYGEHLARRGPPDMIVVKAGSGIGTGVVTAGRVHRGATYAAGDITHVRVASAGDRPCSCGNLGCLETVASGAALAQDLALAGLDVGDTRDVVRLAGAGDVTATTAVRAAGSHLGSVLAAVVNFFNPGAVYLGGSLSTLQPFVAAVRSRLYEDCHPLATEHLAIARTTSARDCGLLGAARIAFDALLDQAGRSEAGVGR
jgi:predicted NBD/HSP70 family sugar kinase